MWHLLNRCSQENISRTQDPCLLLCTSRECQRQETTICVGMREVMPHLHTLCSTGRSRRACLMCLGLACRGKLWLCMLHGIQKGCDFKGGAQRPAELASLQ